MNEANWRSTLSKILYQLSPDLLRYLMYVILGSVTADDLRRDGHQATCLEFLGYLERTDQVDKLIAILLEDDRFIHVRRMLVSPPSSPRPQPSTTSQFDPPNAPAKPASTLDDAPKFSLPFTNRQNAIQDVVDKEPKATFHFFEGPTGYGKTRLLEQLKKDFERWHWYCLCLTVGSEANPAFGEQILAQLPSFIQKSPPFAPQNWAKGGRDLGQALARYHERHPYPGVVLLIDIPDEFAQGTKTTLKQLVEAFIPEIYDGLSRSRYFSREASSYRVVLTGRSKGCLSGMSYSNLFRVTALKPLRYTYVQEICKEAIQHEMQVVEEFAANLFFVSGGHPGCIEKILHLYKGMRGQEPATFFVRCPIAIQEVIENECGRVRETIDPAIQSAYEQVYIYRRLNDHLIKIFWKRLDWHGDAFTLQDDLMRSSLFGWHGDDRRHLVGDIVRRLLTVHARYEAPDRFKQACEKASHLSLKALKVADELRGYWVVEVLFQLLQARFDKIESAAQRQVLRATLMSHDLPNVLTAYVEGRPTTHQADLRSLEGILEADWEFQFALNFYLRDQSYDAQPYDEFCKQVKAFFGKL